MGYFKKKLRRGNAAKEKRQQGKEGLPPALDEWIAAGSRSPTRDQAKYVRLSTDQNDLDSQQFLGVFRVAGKLERSSNLHRDDYEQLKKALDWFNANLPVPRGVPMRAIFWFKSDAGESINRIWKIVNVLRAYGHEVRMMRTHKPGRIVYEDEFQIAAIAKWKL